MAWSDDLGSTIAATGRAADASLATSARKSAANLSLLITALRDSPVLSARTRERELRAGPVMKRFRVLLLGLGFLACGGSITSPGQDGSVPAGSCATLGACECAAASDRCAPRTEACYCPTNCNPNIVCICGGGRFLACDERVLESRTISRSP